MPFLRDELNSLLNLNNIGGIATVVIMIMLTMNFHINVPSLLIPITKEKKRKKTNSNNNRNVYLHFKYILLPYKLYYFSIILGLS
jgi:hypothetical protein